MCDDEVQAEIRRAWDDWQDRLAPDDMRFLENAAADVAVLASDESVRARFRDGVTRFAAQYAAFRTARKAWDANPRTWRAEMGRPTNPLGAIWPYTYGTGWKGWQDLKPAGCGGRAWSPLLHEIEKEVPMILGAYGLLAVTHDKILPQSTRINDGFLAEDLAQKIWWSFLNDVDRWGITGGRPQYVISRRYVEGALARVTQDAKSEPQHAPIDKPEEKPNGSGQAGEDTGARLSVNIQNSTVIMANGDATVHIDQHAEYTTKITNVRDVIAAQPEDSPTFAKVAKKTALDIIGGAMKDLAKGQVKEAAKQICDLAKDLGPLLTQTVAYGFFKNRLDQ